MDYLQNLYTQFLSHFPGFLHPIISLVLVILLVYSIFQTLKRNFIFIILLIVLLPASIPILKSVWEGILAVIKLLLGMW
jgi:hypothetical protein